MWFWAVNEMTELVSRMPAPQFGDESSWVRGSELIQGQAVPVFRYDWCKMSSRAPGSRQSPHTRRRGCQPYAQAAFNPSHEDSWYSYLLETELTPVPTSSGNWTLYLPACIIAPQPTTVLCPHSSSFKGTVFSQMPFIAALSWLCP
jgi:hypothetical protein